MMLRRNKYPPLVHNIFSYWLAPSGNNLRIFPDDTFLVSFPRSGNTWLRFLLGELIFDQEIDFNNMENYIPDIYFSSKAKFNRISRPRYIKSHEPYDYRYPKVIYLVRDPRDVAISYYYWLLKFRKLDIVLTQFIEDFIENRTPFGGWGEHVNSWYQHRSNLTNGIIFIRYEDLLSDTYTTLQKILAFLEVRIPLIKIEKVIAQNTFSQMQAKETRNQNAPIFSNTRQDVSFIRKGQTRQWDQEISNDQSLRISNAYGNVASNFEYNLHE